jgi:hypothetical protein
MVTSSAWIYQEEYIKIQDLLYLLFGCGRGAVWARAWPIGGEWTPNRPWRIEGVFQMEAAIS